MARQTTRSTAWVHAAMVRAQLAAGGWIDPIPLPPDVHSDLGWDDGEYPVGYFPGGLSFARYYPTVVSYGSARPTIVFGSPAFVAGAVSGATVRSALQRRVARRRAAAQWRSTPLRRVVLTTRRLWCQVVEDGWPRWVRIGFDSVRYVMIRSETMILDLAGGEPLRLAGPDALWCAAVIAHFRFGPAADRVLPELNLPIAG